MPPTMAAVVSQSPRPLRVSQIAASNEALGAAAHQSAKGT